MKNFVICRPYQNLLGYKMSNYVMGETSRMGKRELQRDSKRWTQFRTSIFPELYMVCE